MNDDLYHSLDALRLDPDSAAPHVELRRALSDLLVGAEALGEGLPARSEAELAAMAPHTLLAWLRDGDGNSFAVIPEAALEGEPGASLLALGSQVFVGAEDFDVDGFVRLLRVYAAVVGAVDGGGEAADLWPWIEQDTASWSAAARERLPTRAELDALSNRWRDYFGADLDQRLTRVVAVRQMT